MILFHVKTLLAVLFVAAGATAALSMLTLMGKSEKKMSVTALKATHRVAGYAFIIILVVLAALGLKYLSAAGDTLAMRGVLHWTLGSLLVFLLLLKLLVVRVFRQFLKFAPVMGMMVIVLAFVVVTLSAVFFVVTGGVSSPLPAEVAEEQPQKADEVPVNLGSGKEQGQQADSEPAPSGGAEAQRADDAAPAEFGDAEAGRETFAGNCADCHNADSDQPKIGPGLAGLFGRETLKIGGKPVTRRNVRDQIAAPVGTMPAFGEHLTDSELDNLTAYLETL